MLNQYTWGDFALFVLCLVVLYYMVVGFMFYRDELGSIFTKKGGGGAQLAGAAAGPGAAASGPPSLVRTTSAFVAATPTATESKAAVDAPEAQEGAAQNLSDGEPVAVVTGSLPDSTAAATGLDDGQSAAVPMDSASSADTDVDTAVEFDEQRTEELDKVDNELAARVSQLAVEMPTDETEDEPSGIIEKNNNETAAIETISTFTHVEAETAYSDASVNDGDLLFAFEEPIASPVDVVSMPTEQLFSATSVVEFIAQAQAGNRPALPAAIKDTSLANLVADKVAESNAELNDLFGADS